MADTRAAVTAPPAKPPIYSLLIVAEKLGLTDDQLASGYVFDPEVCGGDRGGVIAVECHDSTPMTAPGQEEWVRGDPFLIWAADECSVLGMDGRDFEGRARRMLAASESYWLARQLEAGALNLEQKSLNDPSTLEDVTTPGAHIAHALSALEEAMAEQGRGERGMVHVTIGTLILLFANSLIRRDGTLWVTASGNIVVADAGYQGVEPGEVTPPDDDTRYMYGTSMVQVQLGTIEIVPGTLTEAKNRADATNRAINLVSVYAERIATYLWDPCIHAAAAYSIAASLPGGGGGGGGDASAANQTTMITALNSLLTNLGDADVNLEALETLMGTLNSSTDGLETLIGTTNTNLATLDGHLNPTIVVEPVSADETIASANWLWGYSIWNTTAGLAEITIHNGDDSADPVLVRIRLVENESVTVMFPKRLPAPDGIRFEMVTGTAAGQVFYEV